MRNEDSLATILLVSPLHSEGLKPLRAPEYWRLRRRTPRLGSLLGRTETDLAGMEGFSTKEAARIVALLDRAGLMAFELERLEHAGIWAVTPCDDDYPQRLADLLGSRAPTLLHGAGDVDLLSRSGIGVVGSRNVSTEGGEVAKAVAGKAVDLGLTVVSGGARGVDQLAMNAAHQAGGGVVGILADSLVRRLKGPDVRMAIHEGRTAMCSPHGPEAPFRVWNAMGRNKLIYALSELTVVVACEPGKGGTWAGATEALKRGFGRVAVWRGPGEGSGNVRLQELGAEPLRSMEELGDIARREGEPKEAEEVTRRQGSQGVLFPLS